MPKWIPQTSQDYVLNQIAASDEIASCSAQPSDWYQAARGSLWIPSATHYVGDVVHPPTSNGFIYECTVGGTSGSGEPGWGVINDGTFSDNDITWKTHTSYALINSPLVPGNFSLSTDGSLGRVLTIAQLVGIVVHTSGDVAFTAYLLSSDKSIRHITTSATTLGSPNSVVEGRTTILNSSTVTVPQPS